MPKRYIAILVSFGAGVLAAGNALAQTVYSGPAETYYVSPTGSDSNTGLSPSSPWQSLAKVDSTDLTPGSQVLFQDGGNWYGQQLDAPSSGTATDPITFGSYGMGANPTFWGSVIVPTTSFQLVSGTTDTYFEPTATTVNAFLVNHQFTHQADLLSGQTTAAGNISYVENTADTSYYDPSANGGLAAGLYVNTGGALSASNTYTTAVQQDVLEAYGQNNLVFNGINVAESAQENGGYGIRIENTSNVTVENLNVTAAGKHAVGAIDSTGFVGQNITASNLMPDQGYGGATAFVSYADYDVANTTSSWINDSFTNANGPYQALITHSTPSATDLTPISSVYVLNMYTDSDPGISVYTAGNETVNIVGGQVANGTIDLDGNNTTINGMLLTGAAASISVNGGSGNVIENSIINGAEPSWWAGHNGAIVDSGTGTVIRYNTIVLGNDNESLEAAIGLNNNSTGTQIYGNIIDTPENALLLDTGSTIDINAFDNLFAGTSNPQIIFVAGGTGSMIELPTTISSDEMYGDPDFVNAAAGDFALEPGSIAAYVFDPTSDEYVMYDYYSDMRPSELTSLGAIEVPEPGSLSLLAAIPLLVLGRRRGRRSPASLR